MAAFGVDHTALLYAGEVWTAGDNLFGQLLRPETHPGFQATGLPATLVRAHHYHTYFATGDGVYHSGPLTRVLDQPVRDFLVLRHGHYLYLTLAGECYRWRDGVTARCPVDGPGAILRRSAAGPLARGVDARWWHVDTGMSVGASLLPWAGTTEFAELACFDGSLYALHDGVVRNQQGKTIPFQPAWYDGAPDEIVALAANQEHLLALTADQTLWHYGRASSGFTTVASPLTEFPALEDGVVGEGTVTGRREEEGVPEIIGLYAEGAGFAAQYHDGGFALWGSNMLGQLGSTVVTGDGVGPDGAEGTDEGPGVVQTWGRATGKKGCGCG